MFEVKTLAILGNGFDVHFDLKTQYKDFYFFLSIINESDDKKFFYKKINEKFDKIDVKEEICNKVYDKYKKDYSNNFFVKYFLRLEKYDINWVGIENELSVILHLFDDAFNIVKLVGSSKDKLIIKFMDILPTDEYYNAFLCLNNIFNEINECDIYKITDNLITLFGKSTPIIGKGNPQTNAIILNDFLSFFPYLLLNSLNRFEELFSIYIYYFIPQVVKIEKDIFKIPERDRGLFPDDCSDGYLSPEKVISYNYTNYGMNNFELDREDVCFVHGRIIFENDILSNNNCSIVFGIDSSETGKFINKKYNIFTKKIRRVLYNTDVNNLKKYCDNVQNIVVYGHSLDFADNDSLSIIINDCMDNYYAAKDRKSKEKSGNPFAIFEWDYDFKIIIYYYDEFAKRNLVCNLERILKDKFVSMFHNNQIFLYEMERKK